MADKHNSALRLHDPVDNLMNTFELFVWIKMSRRYIVIGGKLDHGPDNLECRRGGKRCPDGISSLEAN
ncbi:hypothetical protein Q1695_001555 [Nippostrongylus brasiliensis]|nr:hypothetical protein Q1695_001555 [Nippostrongylus brasiliensis]